MHHGTRASAVQYGTGILVSTRTAATTPNTSTLPGFVASHIFVCIMAGWRRWAPWYSLYRCYNFSGCQPHIIRRVQAPGGSPVRLPHLSISAYLLLPSRHQDPGQAQPLPCSSVLLSILLCVKGRRSDRCLGPGLRLWVLGAENQATWDDPARACSCKRVSRLLWSPPMSVEQRTNSVFGLPGLVRYAQQ